MVILALLRQLQPILKNKYRYGEVHLVCENYSFEESVPKDGFMKQI